MPIIALVGAPHCGKTTLIHNVEKYFETRELKAKIIVNAIDEFFDNCFKTNPMEDRYDVNQSQIMQKQYNRETRLDKDIFNLIKTPLLCNYCTALVDVFNSSSEELKKSIPDYYDKALECVKMYDFVIFLDFVSNPSDRYLQNIDKKNRCFKISKELKKFLDDNKIEYYHAKKITGAERNVDIYGAIKEKFGLSRRSKAEQNFNSIVSHETTEKTLQKDSYLDESWKELVGTNERKEKIREKKWQKRK